MRSRNKLKHLILLAIILSFGDLLSQDFDEYVEPKKDHRVGGFIGYNNYPGGAFNNFRSFFIASIGLEYDYKFSDRWGFGLKLDLIYPKYSIPNGLGLPDIVVKYPSVMMKYYFSDSFNGLVGAGVEIIENSTFETVKIGAEYKLKFTNDWDLKPVFSYSFVNGFEDTYEIIFSIGKTF